MKIIVVLLLAFLAIASATSARQQWDLFKSKFARLYASQEEESYRFTVFKQNLQIAKQMNHLPGQTAQYGVTKFSDLTTSEFKALHLMNVTRDNLAGNMAGRVRSVELPSSFDWKSKGAVTPVKDQGQCGSCWDFSATETIESVCFLAGYGLQTLSEQQILDCDTTDGGCNGGWPYNAYQYVISAGGIESESKYPYTAQDGSCQFNPSYIACKVTSWKYVTQSKDENQMQNFLYTNSPMSVCVDASSWQFYNGGVITTSSGCGTDIDHCVQVTGWSVQSGVNAWTVRNSWGTDWGVSGFLYVQIGGDVCAIAEVVTVPCVQSQSGQSFC